MPFAVAHHFSSNKLSPIFAHTGLITVAVIKMAAADVNLLACWKMGGYFLLNRSILVSGKYIRPQGFL